VFRYQIWGSNCIGVLGFRLPILGKTSKENCIVIEDSDNGIKAANDANIFVFGYKNPMCSDQTLEHADAIIEDFYELQKII
jgi:beta-phosphoglucomutase-like phosphatase (HAD superfamily)